MVTHLTPAPQTTLSRYSYEQARQEIQASDAELRVGLRDRRILVLDGPSNRLSPVVFVLTRPHSQATFARSRPCILIRSWSSYSTTSFR